LYTKVTYIVYIVMIRYKIMYPIHFILQSISADSVEDTRHKKESSQNSTRSCVITHFTQRVEYDELWTIWSTWEVCVSQ